MIDSFYLEGMLGDLQGRQSEFAAIGNTAMYIRGLYETEMNMDEPFHDDIVALQEAEIHLYAQKELINDLLSILELAIHTMKQNEHK